MDPTHGATTEPVVFAQITVPSGSQFDGVISAQGKSTGGGSDWLETGMAFNRQSGQAPPPPPAGGGRGNPFGPPPPPAGGCVDDPTGAVAGAGQSCPAILPMLGNNCDFDLSTLAPTIPAGTTLRIACPLSCNACGAPPPAPPAGGGGSKNPFGPPPPPTPTPAPMGDGTMVGLAVTQLGTSKSGYSTFQVSVEFDPRTVLDVYALCEFTSNPPVACDG